MATTLELKNQWRFLVTKTNGAALTFLDRLTTNVQLGYVLNAPYQATGDLPSDNPEVNIPAADGDPFVSFNNRLVYGFRRESSVPPIFVAPWTCRFAGVMQILEDEARTNEPVTHWTAYDPWMWLNSIPIFTQAGDLLGKNGISFSATPGSTIARNLLTWALAVVVAQNPSNPLYIDDSSGHFDTTDAIDIDFQQGTSVGEAWTQLVDTGSMDIVLTPVYDPSTRPGKLAVLNIYSQAGTEQDAAIFAWDKMPRSLRGIDRLNDGTQMVNVSQLYANGLPATQATNAASVAAYGQWWAQGNYPAPSSKTAVALIAAAQVALRKRGKTTLTIDPEPERSPDPFTEYFLGDRVPVYAGRTQAGNGVSLREPLNPGIAVGGVWPNPQRVYGMPITLNDDMVESVDQLLMTGNDPSIPS